MLNHNTHLNDHRENDVCEMEKQSNCYIKELIVMNLKNKPVMNMLLCFGRLFFSVLIAVGLLSVFVFLYSYAGIHLTNTTKSTDYKWRPNELKTTMTEGFVWLRMDESGFNNDKVPTKIDNLIIGSSHMEAANMKPSENVSGILNQRLPLATYNIGVSGHTIYRCVDNYEAALEEFCPTKYSIVETSSIELSVSDMQSVIEGNAKRIPSYDTGLIYYLQMIPAFRPIYNQLDNWATLENHAGGVFLS